MGMKSGEFGMRLEKVAGWLVYAWFWGWKDERERYLGMWLLGVERETPR